MKPTKRRKARRRLPLFSAACIALLILVLAWSGYTAAKYITSRQGRNLYAAQAFYFTSDFLEPRQANGEYKTFTLQEGKKQIDLTLFNSDDELRTSEVEFEYQVFYQKDGESKKNQVTQKETFEIGGEAVPITIANLDAGTYLVTAEVTKPYTKTIGAKFKITDTKYQIDYTTSADDSTPLMLLTVQTNDYSGDVVISWGTGIYPDKTDPMLADAPYGSGGGSVTIELPSNASYTFRFLKSDLSKKAELSAKIP